MKNLITILTVLTITFSSAFANTSPEVLTNSETVEVVIVESLEIFTNATFDSTSDNLVFDTKTDISVVQIYTAGGELEFQLPVGSTNIQINKNLFDQGIYKLGFILDGQSEIHFTKVTIK